MITPSQKKTFEDQGFVILPGLFNAHEVAELRDHFMELRKEPRPGDFNGVDPASDDPLIKYPRMIHMHRWDERSLQWLIDARLRDAMKALLGEEPFAVQTMLYYKPAGARGQALHQDQFYLRAQPGTCIAAWMALDDCDEENGCMQLVPGTHELPVLCTVPADTKTSFTDVTVPLPEGMSPVPARMDAGDVLFFSGSVIHGSFPNTSQDRFRRSLIGHYVTGNATQVANYFHPALRMDGTVVELETSEGGGACGAWVSVDGKPSIEMREPSDADLLVAHE